MTTEEVPSPWKSGIAYTTISVSPLLYLPWLKTQLDERGVIFVRKRVRSIEELADIAGLDGIIVNASSMGELCVCDDLCDRLTLVVGARSLVGVQDTKMYPVRGQTILVKAPLMHEFLQETTSEQ